MSGPDDFVFNPLVLEYARKLAEREGWGEDDEEAVIEFAIEVEEILNAIGMQLVRKPNA